LVRGGGASFAFAANIIIARLLGPEKFGIYITMLSAALVAGAMATYGVGSVLVREIAARSVEQRRTIVVAISFWALRFTGVLSVCAMMVILVWLGLGPGSPSSIWLERFAVLGIIPMYVGAILAQSVLSGMHRVAQGQAIVNVVRNGLLFVGVYILLLVGVHRVIDVLWLQVLGFALAMLVGIYWIFRAIPTSDVHTLTTAISATGGRVPKALSRGWRKSARHFFSMSVAVLLLVRLDVIIVNAIAGSTQAGLFGAAARLGQMATIAGMVWMVWLQPRMARQSKLGQKTELKRSLQLGIAGSVGMTGILVVLGWWLAPQLMLFMGSGFSGAVWPFRWLLLGSLVWGLSVPFYALLTMSGRERLVSWILWFQVVLTLAASVPLVTYFGALGGAWSWAGGAGIASLILVIAGIFERHWPLAQGRNC
jgi:O-antigen/teichoic acid export membrane protein